MTTSLEDLVREAQRRQADRAVPVEVLRPALTARIARTRRRRRIGALATAAAAALAIAAPAAIRGLTGPADPVVPAAPRSALSLDLGYRPTWTPDGFAERGRSAILNIGDERGATLTRTYSPDAGVEPAGVNRPFISLDVSTAVPDPEAVLDKSGPPADINGKRGYFRSTLGEKWSVSWSPGPRTVLTIVKSGGVSERDMLRFARSVRPEKGTFAEPVRLGLLPASVSTRGIQVSGTSPASWRADVFTSLSGNKRSLSVLVAPLGDMFVPRGGRKLTVGGRPARNPVGANGCINEAGCLVVDLGKGRALAVTGRGLTLDEMIRVAERAEITGAGTEWIGRR